MKKVIKKTNMYQFDVPTVIKARKFLTEKYMRGDYGESKETIHEFISILEDILSSVKTEEIEVERRVRESEDEARQYFGEDFVRQFEQIRKYCTENNLMLAIHGTKPQLLDSIQQNGLEYQHPEIIIDSFNYDMSYDKEELQALLKQNNLLSQAYDEWLSADGNLRVALEYSIDNVIEMAVKERT